MGEYEYRRRTDFRLWQLFQLGKPLGELEPWEIFASKFEVDNIVGSERDIAAMNMGDNWRMPTPNELRELRDKCD